ncbi:hypothetical protein CDL12_23908 [Handroanthus impetiginosus]|uniref:Uncharacterized protein n=1 Tax=Handroanthus impetiginosus TaxID=429701 RepID=A0A2G9GE49_9LAMI|nr:hypothetical protein CDL12_23908 [Handroanthus impetiginosus]
MGFGSDDNYDVKDAGSEGKGGEHEEAVLDLVAEGMRRGSTGVGKEQAWREREAARPTLELTGERDSGGDEEETADDIGEDNEVMDDISPTQLAVEELSVLSRRVRFPMDCRCVLPSSRAQASNPAPEGHFTVFTFYFRVGLTIPPDPLLVELVRTYGICLSQLIPNSFMYFTGFHYPFEEPRLPLSMEGFQSLFLMKKVPKELFFYFFPHLGCKFLGRVSSSWEP